MTDKSPQTTKKRECFELSPIGKDNSDPREHADTVFKYILESVLKDDYHIERADKIDESGVITNQIIERIVNSDLIIAILTYDNPNVFYELALCHVARKPFIQMIEKDKKIPFDTSHVRTIQYGLDVKSAEETKDRLKNLLQRNLDGNIENPISLGLDALKLKESNNHKNRLLLKFSIRFKI